MLFKREQRNFNKPANMTGSEICACASVDGPPGGRPRTAGLTDKDMIEGISEEPRLCFDRNSISVQAEEFMTMPSLRWTLSAGWIGASLLIFFGLGALSTRSWIYLVTVALVPPIVLLSLWPSAPAQTIADVTRGSDGRS